MLLTSGLNREVAAGKGLEPAVCKLVGVTSLLDTVGERASPPTPPPTPTLGCVCVGCVCRLAASKGGCNTLDPRFIFFYLCVCL